MEEKHIQEMARTVAVFQVFLQVNDCGINFTTLANYVHGGVLLGMFRSIQVFRTRAN